MPKTAPLKASPSARGRAPLKPAERRQKIAALCAEVTEFWKDKPETGAVDHLMSLRRAKA